MAGSQTIEIRQLFHLPEFTEVLRLQQVIWGFADVELLPLRFLVVVSKVGGHVFGAYISHPLPDGSGGGDEMIGFCFAIPGVKPGGRPYLHSHMLGVLPQYHNAGIGRRLKLRQREEALGRGIDLIEWTFDPLELKNAFLNIEKLGAIVRRYSLNQYGVTASPLHGGLPTDRCIAEWWLDSPRVRGVLEGMRPDRHPQECISFPTDIARIRSEEPARARQIQHENAEKFQRAFERGLAVTGFEPNATEGTYLLEPWQ
ncbi:GCN5-related N-acetyltransferase [Candidatus Sulfopaludibacter sp. SbA4]|nr:GCN5-related N-acetyltransferase [Candidatus Sulfopaludibacter sp. SbA4]